MIEDPPCLDEAAKAACWEIEKTCSGCCEKAGKCAGEPAPIFVNVARAVLAVAARQLREITEAEVKAAARRWLKCDEVDLNIDDIVDARAALEAADKVRIKELERHE